jgi:YfiH family protein
VVAFSTREGGVSDGPYESLNLGLMTDDLEANVQENRRRLCAAVEAQVDALALNRQVHGATVNEARAGGRGTPGDALWTEERGLPILTMTADCLPIALVRATGERPGVAVVHAGWRGLLGGVAANAVNALGRGQLVAAIGPTIGPCCYEVREDVARPMRAAFGFGLHRDGRLDLRAAAERALRAAGVARVEHVDGCTSCAATRFFSHRRDRGVTGRQGLIAYVA